MYGRWCSRSKIQCMYWYRPGLQMVKKSRKYNASMEEKWEKLSQYRTDELKGVEEILLTEKFVFSQLR